MLANFIKCLVWPNGRKSAFYFIFVKRVRFVLTYIKTTALLCSLYQAVPYSSSIHSFYIILLKKKKKNSRSRALKVIPVVCFPNSSEPSAPTTGMYHVRHLDLVTTIPHLSAWSPALASDNFAFDTAPFVLIFLCTANISVALCTAPKATFLWWLT